MSALSVVAAPSLPGISDLSPEALDYGRAALSPNTMRAYEADWREFRAWCASRGRSALPATPATVANYASGLADGGKRVSTISRKLAAVRFFHRGAGMDVPTDNAGVAAILKGIRRTVGVAPRQKAPATADVTFTRCLRTCRATPCRASATGQSCCWASLARSGGRSW